MCGITGFFRAAPHAVDDPVALLSRMTAAIVHRGPDDGGVWFDPGGGVGLGHRRLSIVDLSPAGHQPMHAPSGRYVIVFNGEIYNHPQLRAQLEAQGVHDWRGHSDTETLLAGFDTWGVRTTIERTVGMFAFAVWDRQAQALMLGRDRLGEKPLYYGWQGRGRDAAFLFGSELKALCAHPAFEHRIDRRALALQLRHNYIPAPYSIYEGISKLEPGCLLTLWRHRREPLLERYWSAAEQARCGQMTPFQGTPRQAVDELEVLLTEAVRGQMAADVPLGAFLSGGVDSSTVVALMQRLSPRAVKTFSIGFHEPGYDEAVHAQAVARHLGTEHTELYVSAQQVRDVIPRLPGLYDEPFSDSSQLPTFLVSQLAREHVTVSLSGDGGDELFGGYERYRMAGRIWRLMNAAPLALRRIAASGLTSVPVHAWDRLASGAARLLPPLRLAHAGHKVHKGARSLQATSLDALYQALVSHWDQPSRIVIGGSEPPTALTAPPSALQGLDGMQRMMALDMLSYLPDDILVKVDRAAMGISLETRVPFLDHRVVEFAWRLPLQYKLRGGVAKWVLREVLYRHVPKTLIDRPKMGFAVPIGAWLRGPLRDWGESLLDASRLRREGYLDPVEVRTKWEEHLSGQRNWQYLLWDVLMFQSWHEQAAATDAPHTEPRLAQAQ